MSTQIIMTDIKEWLLDVRAFDTLRIMSQNTQDLLLALQEVQPDIDKISKLLSLEPVLSAKLLMICNSSFFGFSREISSIDEAVVILGAVKLTSMIYSSLVLVDTDDVAHKNYIRHSLMTSLFCKAIAEKAGFKSDIPFTAGLFHILPVIVNYRPNIGSMLSAPVLKLAVGDMLNNLRLPFNVIDAAVGLYARETHNLDSVCLRIGFNLSIICLGKKYAAFSQLINIEHDFNRIRLTPKEVSDILKETKSEQAELNKLIG